MPVDNLKINEALKGIRYCIKNNIPILLMGNGGSAFSTAHFAQDINKVLGGNAFSLTDNYGLITAIANDCGYEEIFSFQIENFALNNSFPVKKIPLIIAISYSGLSKNILNAAKYSRNIGYPVLSFTGNDGGKLVELSNLNINIPSDNIYAVESTHSILFHYFIDTLNNGDNDNDIVFVDTLENNDSI